jgi:hypothetical protein
MDKGCLNCVCNNGNALRKTVRVAEVNPPSCVKAHAIRRVSNMVLSKDIDLALDTSIVDNLEILMDSGLKMIKVFGIVGIKTRGNWNRVAQIRLVILLRSKRFGLHDFKAFLADAE